MMSPAFSIELQTPVWKTSNKMQLKSAFYGKARIVYCLIWCVDNVYAPQQNNKCGSFPVNDFLCSAEGHSPLMAGTNQNFTPMCFEVIAMSRHT